MLHGAKALVLGALLVLVFATGQSVVAQSDNAAVLEGQAKLRLARQLVDYAKASKDGLALATGVRMMANVKGTILADGEKGKGGKALDLKALLDQAAEFSKDNAATQGVIKDVRDMMAKAPKARPLCFWEYWCNWYGCYYSWICF